MYLMVSLKTLISFLVHIVASSGSWNCPVMLSWTGKRITWKLQAEPFPCLNVCCIRVICPQLSDTVFRYTIYCFHNISRYKTLTLELLSHHFNLTSLSSIVSVAISPSRDFSSTRLKYVTVKINEYYYYCSVKMKRILNLQKPGFLFSLLFTIFSFFCATVHLDNTSLWQPEGVKRKG